MSIGGIPGVEWVKSSYSGGNEGQCLDVARCLSPSRGTPKRDEWIKSSHSGGNEGECVEIFRRGAATGTVPVRDSKRPRGAALAIPAPAWTAFVAALQEGTFIP
ncbi:DUF397 domain-containing protein [Streptomyces sp. ET3-23]|uniref:DUF397 domain-containing protein n=1 Tax=Streptomyces sp. ET3-23 TaxID=2885643 RepID=UPI001D0F94A9|nr:DUF397 domain-containing protein [Streptomyces sp. ET3-23]MCC2276916.1 DUF397 domain-containing protein [Streptomyces sp. ET3-23]